MEIRKPATTGTLEFSDCQVTVESGEGNIEFAFESAVINQYGNQIKRVIMETLENLGARDVRIVVVGKGALGCTIRTRVEGAVSHAARQYDSLP